MKEHLSEHALMFKQILSRGTMRIVWKTILRMCMLILERKGLISARPGDVYAVELTGTLYCNHML